MRKGVEQENASRQARWASVWKNGGLRAGQQRKEEKSLWEGKDKLPTLKEDFIGEMLGKPRKKSRRVGRTTTESILGGGKKKSGADDEKRENQGRGMKKQTRRMDPRRWVRGRRDQPTKGKKLPASWKPQELKGKSLWGEATTC